jgi:hypothetical protein
MQPKGATMNIKKEVDRMFDELSVCQNPVTGWPLWPEVIPEEDEKRIARKALRARKWFAEHGPADCQPLPLSHFEWTPLKNGGVAHFLALYAQSLASLNYDIKRHPTFDVYVMGVMVDHAAYFSSENEMFRSRCRPGRHLESLEELLRRFPPRRLEGLNMYVWRPVKKRAARGSRAA